MTLIGRNAETAKKTDFVISIQNHSSAANSEREAINNVNRECVPSKTIRKLIWTDQLTQLSNQERYLVKAYKRTSKLQNREALLKARARFKR